MWGEIGGCFKMSLGVTKEIKQARGKRVLPVKKHLLCKFVNMILSLEPIVEGGIQELKVVNRCVCIHTINV